MRVCQAKINIEAHTKLESVDDTIKKNKGATRKDSYRGTNQTRKCR